MGGTTPGETMRVLLVSTDEGMRDQIQEALPGAIRDCRVYWVSQPDLAVTPRGRPDPPSDPGRR